MRVRVPSHFVFFVETGSRWDSLYSTCGSNGRQLEANWIIKCFSISGLNRSGGVGSAGGGGLNEPLYRNVFQGWWVVEYVQMDEKEETLSLDRSVMMGVQMSRQSTGKEPSLDYNSWFYLFLVLALILLQQFRWDTLLSCKSQCCRIPWFWLVRKG